jgi:hypothetical protein
MLIPAWVEATFIDEQTRWVSANASGIASMSDRSPFAMPFRFGDNKDPCKFGLESRLADVFDIAVFQKKIFRDCRQDAGPVLRQNGDNHFFHYFLL